MKMNRIIRSLCLLALAAASSCSYMDLAEPVPAFDIPDVVYEGQTYTFRNLVPRISYQWSLSDGNNAWIDNGVLIASAPRTKAIAEEGQHLAKPLTILAVNRRHPEYTFEKKTEIHPWNLVFTGGSSSIPLTGSCAVGSTVRVVMYDVVSKMAIGDIDDGKRQQRYRDVQLVLDSVSNDHGLELVSSDNFSMTFSAREPGSYTVTATLKNGSRKDEDLVVSATLVVAE